MVGDQKELVEHGTMWRGRFIPVNMPSPWCSVVMVRNNEKYA